MVKKVWKKNLYLDVKMEKMIKKVENFENEENKIGVNFFLNKFY